MPIGRGFNVTNTGAFVSIPGTTGLAAEPVQTGLAVAITSEGICACSNIVDGTSFAGFAMADVATGQPVAVMCMRGSLVTPLREGNTPLIPDAPVYLSGTLGQVTPVVPTGLVLRVGTAISPTQMVMVSDPRVWA